MNTCSRVLEFDYGHRVLGHGGKCAHLHGHRGKAIIHAQGALNSLGMVVDFSLIKQLVGTWVDENWDHNLLLNSEDPAAKLWAMAKDIPLTLSSQMFSRAPYILLKMNPTAEVMAQVLYHEASVLLAIHDIKVIRVDLYETPNCWATYEGG